MSIIQRMAMLAGGSHSVVTLSGESGINSLDLSGPYDARSGIRVTDTGLVYKYIYSGSGPVLTQIDSLTDWIIPPSAASSAYEFKLEVTSFSPNFISDSTALWIAMGSGTVNSSYLQWVYQIVVTGQADSFNWTLRVRKSGGAELDNAVYSGLIDTLGL